MQASSPSRFAAGTRIDGAQVSPLRGLLAHPRASLEDIFARVESGAMGTAVIRHPARHLLGSRVHIPAATGAGAFELTRLGDEAFLMVLDASFKSPTTDVIPGDGLIQFYFKLSGDYRLSVAVDQGVRMQRPGLLVFSRPAGADLQEWTAPCSRECGVALTVRPQYLMRHFLSGSTNPPHFLRALAEGRDGRAQCIQLQLSARMSELAGLLVDNPYTEPALRLLHAEALSVQLLCAAVEGFMNADSDPGKDCSERELRCLEAARSILMEEFCPVPTIRQIATRVGMSETSLKQRFKCMFGETLYEFSVRCRMQRAMQLLQEGQTPVARIAEAVGYSHQTSFATAFREHFQVSPREMRPLKSR